MSDDSQKKASKKAASSKEQENQDSPEPTEAEKNRDRANASLDLDPEPNDLDRDPVEAAKGTPGDPESGDDYDPTLDPAMTSSFVTEQAVLEKEAGFTNTRDGVHNAETVKDSEDSEESDDK